MTISHDASLDAIPPMKAPKEDLDKNKGKEKEKPKKFHVEAISSSKHTSSNVLTREGLIEKLKQKIQSVKEESDNQTRRANQMSAQDRLNHPGKKDAYDKSALQLMYIHQEMSSNLVILEKQRPQETCDIINNKVIITSKEHRGTLFTPTDIPSSESFYDYDQGLEERIKKALTVNTKNKYIK
jgi:hypothetical protein